MAFFNAGKADKSLGSFVGEGEQTGSKWEEESEL